MSRFLLAFALASTLPMTLIADTLVLRNGTRVQGSLVAVRGGTIEFEERRGRTVRVDRSEVARIEIDDDNFGGGRGDYGSGRGDYGGGGDVGRGGSSGLRERQVVVSANTAWTDTGIDVRAGQSVYFAARGQVRWGRDRTDGPEGEKNSPNNPNRPIPFRAAGSLIGKVDSSSNDMFYVGGETGAVRMRSNGRLYLGINDDFLQDNGGSFQVMVRY
jgi:hypothetical protein